MKIVVFGAAGIIGRRLIDQLLSQQHQVVAYDRNIDQWLDKSLEQDEIVVVKGYLLDRKEVEKAIRGTDVVFFLVSGEKEAGDISRSGGIRQVIAGMVATGVQRLLVLGDILLLEDKEGKMIADRDDFPVEQSSYADEYKKMWQQVQASPLQWTVVCPVQLIDGPEEKAYITFREIEIEQNFTPTTSGDLCRFMIREMTNNEFIHQRVGIASLL
jgi:putative NADH-flavin reductase